MRFEVGHTTVYSYSKSVALQPHEIRLRPRADRMLHLDEYRLDIEPTPAGRTDYEDVEGNGVTRIWFIGETRHLTIRSSFRAETLRTNPFDYIVLDPSTHHLPMDYGDGTASLARYRERHEDDAVSSLAREALVEHGPDATRVLLALAARFGAFEQETRERGAPFPPAETLARQAGACRDLAVLFIEASRALGLAARFVSGYQAGDPAMDERTLHAWTEVYLPGAGWRGFDPSHGIAVADQHVPVAVAPDPDGAAPTIGRFGGDQVVETSMEVSIDIRVDGSAAATPSEPTTRR